MDPSRRETSLFMGLGLTVVVVASLFFGITMGVQRLGQRRARWLELREQLVQAERQAQQRARPIEQGQLAAETRAAAQFFVTPQDLSTVQEQLQSVAAAAGVQVAFLPALAPEPPPQPLPGFEGCYQVIPLVVAVNGRYRELATFLTQATAMSTPAVALRSGTMTSGPALDGALKTQLVLETFLWIPRVVPKQEVPSPTLPTPPTGPATGSWGHNPFDERWNGPTQAEGLTLQGILWDAHHSTCVLNGAVYGVGQAVAGYTVVAILPKAVLLRGPKELLLAE